MKVLVKILRCSEGILMVLHDWNTEPLRFLTRTHGPERSNVDQLRFRYQHSQSNVFHAENVQGFFRFVFSANVLRFSANVLRFSANVLRFSGNVLRFSANVPRDRALLHKRVWLAGVCSVAHCWLTVLLFSGRMDSLRICC